MPDVSSLIFLVPNSVFSASLDHTWRKFSPLSANSIYIFIFIQAKYLSPGIIFDLSPCLIPHTPIRLIRSVYIWIPIHIRKSMFTILEGSFFSSYPAFGSNKPLCFSLLLQKVYWEFIQVSLFRPEQDYRSCAPDIHYLELYSCN